MRQLNLAGDLLRSGYTVLSFIEDAKGVVQWKREKSQQPPYSLQYFLSRKLSQEKAQSGKDVKDIVKHMASKMKLR